MCFEILRAVAIFLNFIGKDTTECSFPGYNINRTWDTSSKVLAAINQFLFYLLPEIKVEMDEYASISEVIVVVAIIEKLKNLNLVKI